MHIISCDISFYPNAHIIIMSYDPYIHFISTHYTIEAKVSITNSYYSGYTKVQIKTIGLFTNSSYCRICWMVYKLPCSTDDILPDTISWYTTIKD